MKKTRLPFESWKANCHECYGKQKLPNTNNFDLYILDKRKISLSLF